MDSTAQDSATLTTAGGQPHGPVADCAGASGEAMALLRGSLAVGGPSYDAVIAEHTPLRPGAESCRSCGFVYTDWPACPAVILAEAGCAELADRVRVVPAADPEYGALCELSVAMQRMAARLDVIAATAAIAAPANPSRRRRTWIRRAGLARHRV